VLQSLLLSLTTTHNHLKTFHNHSRLCTANYNNRQPINTFKNTEQQKNSHSSPKTFPKMDNIPQKTPLIVMPIKSNCQINILLQQIVFSCINWQPIVIISNLLKQLATFCNKRQQQENFCNNWQPPETIANLL